MSARLQVAWFDDEHRVLDALRICRERGFAVDDVVSPFPIHGLDGALGLRRTRLPWITLAGGVTGLSLGAWFQYWSSASDWPLNVGGKPFDSYPAFVPVMFELTVLLAGLCTVFGLIALCRLWPGKRAERRVQATDDRIAVLIAQRDARHDPREVRQVLLECGALEVEAREEAS